MVTPDKEWFYRFWTAVRSYSKLTDMPLPEATVFILRQIQGVEPFDENKD